MNEGTFFFLTPGSTDGGKEVSAPVPTELVGASSFM
jgi:hypothetical protein